MIPEHLRGLTHELARETTEYPRGERTSEAERKKELVEALDAVVAEFSWYESATGEALFVNAVQRLLNADEVTRRAAIRWVKRFE